MVTEKRREQLRSAQETYRNKNRELCLSMCRKVKVKYRQEGRCSSCGIQLLQGEVKTCVNCGHTIKGEIKYAKDSKALTKVI
jgi:rRNA maturation endonuclease Nob1